MRKLLCIITFLSVAAVAGAVKKTVQGVIHYQDGREVACDELVLPKGGTKKLATMRIIDGKKVREKVSYEGIAYLDVWHPKTPNVHGILHCYEVITDKGKHYPWWLIEYKFGDNIRFYISGVKYRMGKDGLYIVYNAKNWAEEPTIVFTKPSMPNKLWTVWTEVESMNASNKTRERLKKYAIGDDERLCKDIDAQNWKGRVRELYVYIAENYQPKKQ